VLGSGLADNGQPPGSTGCTPPPNRQRRRGRAVDSWTMRLRAPADNPTPKIKGVVGSNPASRTKKQEMDQRVRRSASSPFFLCWGFLGDSHPSSRLLLLELQGREALVPESAAARRFADVGQASWPLQAARRKPRAVPVRNARGHMTRRPDAGSADTPSARPDLSPTPPHPKIRSAPVGSPCLRYDRRRKHGRWPRRSRSSPPRRRSGSWRRRRCRSVHRPSRRR